MEAVEFSIDKPTERDGALFRFTETQGLQLKFTKCWRRNYTFLAFPPFRPEQKPIKTTTFEPRRKEIFCCSIHLSGRRGGLMASTLDSGASGPSTSPGREHCVVLEQDTSLSRCLSPPRCINGILADYWENLTNCREVTCNRLASGPGE